MSNRKISSRITREKFSKAVATHRTSRKVGKALGISHYSVLKYSKKWNVPLLPPDTTGGAKRKRYSSIANFVRNNPNVKLPRKYSDIATLVGCSENAVRLYFSRKRRELKNRVKDLPDLKLLDIRLKDCFDEWYSSKDFKNYYILFDKWSMKIFIDATLKQKINRRFELKDFEELNQLVLQAQKLKQAKQPKDSPLDYDQESAEGNEVEKNPEQDHEDHEKTQNEQFGPDNW